MMFGSFSFTVINLFHCLNLKCTKFRIKLRGNPVNSDRINSSAAVFISTQLGYVIIYTPISQHSV